MTWTPPATTKTYGWKRTSSSREGRGDWSRLRPFAWRRDCGLCQHIRYDTGLPCLAAGAVVDHIVPISQGGSTALDNLQVMCEYHHTRKTALEAAEGRRKARQGHRLGPGRGRRPGTLE
ncbi:HNH endonuclease [Streptomyces yunnanensis]|uniref:5-methylcytosine-specific restriction enzyme A n=1 Tax=Streptomyces yunnanensis TaxID=156453 RepID=A0A9X8N7X3_9ACTN|nr:HNH endonuclease signature motif containing protein [Streptomyces yunnanensis]SHN24622.1 5-methylcytosine-specific restriction enzyme A [Streptomyces yunnanensis]